MPRSSRTPIASRVPMLALLALCAIAAAGAYAATADRASAWRDRDITIDGSDEDWRGQEQPVNKQRFSLGIMNDGEWLYLCLLTKDAGMRTQIGTAGLVVWLDLEGGKKKQFGLHFPVPNPPRSPGMRRPAPEQPPAAGEEPSIPGQQVIGILGPGKNDAKLVSIEEAGGIEGRVGVHDDLTVYEMKVPLVRSAEHQYAPEVRPGQTARLEIETAPARGPITPTGPYTGGFGVVIPLGHGRPSRYPAFSLPFDVTMNVRLARAPQ